jgi:hypothetical protein
MKKRGFRFVARATCAWTFSGSILLAGCGGRTLLEEGGQTGAAGATSGTTSPMGTAGASSGAGGSGLTGTGSGANGLAGSSGFIGTGGSSAGGSSAVTGASGVTTSTLAQSPPLSAVVLDDMEALKAPTGGSWYTYSDRVLPNSAPPIIQTDLPGVMTPPEGTTFAPYTSDPRAPELMINGAWHAVPFREVTGHGNDVWGAGFGLDFSDVRPSPTDSVIASINACPSDAGVSPLFNAMDPDVLVPVAFNAKVAGFTGIGFYATSFSGIPVTIYVELDDPRTSPRGGSCDVCLDGGHCEAAGDGGAACPCYDSFMESFYVSGGWNFYSFHFTDPALVTQNWSGQDLAAGTILSSALYNLHFQLTVAPGQSLPPFDIGVAYVVWLTD